MDSVNFLTTFFSSFSAIVFYPLLKILALMSALIALFWSIKRIFEVLSNADFSARVGGFYLLRTPYKGYNRFRSQKWNSQHTFN